MSMARPAPGRLAIAGVISRREAQAAIRGIGGYVALSVALVAGIWVLLVDVRGLAIGGLLVLADPFGPSLTIVLLVVALYLALSAAVSTARDRENGTLEVLFYGPVDETAYILGKVGGLLFAFVAALPLILAAFGLLSLMTGFALTTKLLVNLALSVVPAAEIVGFGVLLAVGTSRVRTAVLLLIAVIAVLLGISFAYNLVLLIPIADAGSPMLPLRDTLAALDEIVRWLSPFAYLERVVDGVTRGAWQTAGLGLAAALAYAAVVIVLAALWLRRRGVQRSGE
jgi:ABC-type transport system involved in multi-copper enzyme maturation permease subunit